MKNLIKRLQMRRNKEIIEIEKRIREAFIAGCPTHRIPREAYWYGDRDKYLNYFSNQCPLKSIFQSVVRVEACYPEGGCYAEEHILIEFKEYDLDIVSLNILQEKVLREAESK